MDPVVTGLRLVAGLALAFASFSVIRSYFMKPEEFFIRGLRLASDHEFTHSELLLRSFVGAGLLSSAAWALGFVLIVGIVPGMSLQQQTSVWLIVTLVGGIVQGAGAYIYLRRRG